MNSQPEFFQFLYEYCEGKINIRPIPGGNEFHAIEGFQPEICIKNHTGENLYFGVATRDGKGGGKQNIVHIPALFTDVDIKDTSREVVREKFKEIPTKPSAIIETGGGWHLYWRLKEPLEKRDIATCEEYLRKLATYFQGDMGATDASRVLRVPNSKNVKYTPPRDVIIKQLNPKLEYSLDDFDFLPEIEKPQQTPQAKTPDELLEQLRGADDGERNITAASLAGHYIAKKLSKDEVIEILHLWNQRNNPPLSDKRIIQTVESVLKTDSQNHPDNFPHITEVLRQVERDIKAGRHKQIGLDPGYDLLRKTIRALIPGHLWVVGGYTSIGKTAFVIDMVMRLVKQNPAISVFTVEMSKTQYALRMLANQTGIPVLRILLDEVGDAQNEAIYEAIHILNRSNIHIFDDVYQFKNIAEICRKLKPKHGLDVVVIDFIQNLIGQGSIYERMSKLAPMLQGLAKELEMTVIALSQVSNEAVKESLEVIGFKGAGEIAAAADLAIWLERKNKEDRQDPNIMAWIRKNRHGPLGHRILQYVENYTRFEEREDTESNYFQKRHGRKGGVE